MTVLEGRFAAQWVGLLDCECSRYCRVIHPRLVFGTPPMNVYTSQFLPLMSSSGFWSLV